MIVKRCPECAGTGEDYRITGTRRCQGQGGPYEPMEEVLVCERCEGTGRVPDPDFSEDVGAVAAALPVTCSCCGRTGALRDIQHWPEMHGFSGVCTCGTNARIPEDRVWRKVAGLEETREEAA